MAAGSPIAATIAYGCGRLVHVTVGAGSAEGVEFEWGEGPSPARFVANFAVRGGNGVEGAHDDAGEDIDRLTAVPDDCAGVVRQLAIGQEEPDVRVLAGSVEDPR
jgi:hypothetical protein